MNKPSDYPVLLRAIPADDGGGFLAVVIDLPGRLADGDTPTIAFANAQDAIVCWIEAATEIGPTDTGSSVAPISIGKKWMGPRVHPLPKWSRE